MILRVKICFEYVCLVICYKIVRGGEMEIEREVKSSKAKVLLTELSINSSSIKSKHTVKCLLNSDSGSNSNANLIKIIRTHRSQGIER